MYLCDTSTIRNIVMIQCYAPTAAAEKFERQEFYVQLNEILRKQKKDIFILGGDLNAKLGQENEGLEHIMGRHGLGERNESRQLFVDFCAKHDLVIGGTIFPHKDCHKVTWVSPDHKTEIHKKLSIFISFSSAMSAHNMLKPLIFLAHFCI